LLYGHIFPSQLLTNVPKL